MAGTVLRFLIVAVTQIWSLLSQSLQSAMEKPVKMQCAEWANIRTYSRAPDTVSGSQ